MRIDRPAASEFNAFYTGYIGKVPDSGPRAMLETQIGALEKLKSLPEQKANHAYADGKWSVKEVVGHMCDGERVFSYRLLRIARADKTPLAGFEENEWAKAAPHRRRPIAAVVDEFIAVRRATLALIDSLDETAVAGTGVANNSPVSARAICWILAGHCQHHLDVLKERYGI